MTRDEMLEIYNEYAESSKFDNFENMPDEDKLHIRADLHAFLLLDKIYMRIPSKSKDDRMIRAAEHDAIYLSIDLDNIAEVITKDEIISLAKAGVSFSDYDGLYMFI